MEVDGERSLALRIDAEEMGGSCFARSFCESVARAERSVDPDLELAEVSKRRCTESRIKQQDRTHLNISHALQVGLEESGSWIDRLEESCP